MGRRVVIVGAGISGLLACKYTIEKGFNPVVFEAKSSIEEVCLEHTKQPSELENSRQDLRFSDFDWPSPSGGEDGVPVHTEVFEYVNAYARNFGLLPHIRLNCQVTGIRYVGETEWEMEMWDRWGGTGTAFGSSGNWHVSVHNKETDSIEVHQAEFVILCIGRFTGLPDIPELSPGQSIERFRGKVLESMEYSALDNLEAAELIKRKLITVIGSGKSAVDIAAECADTNGAVYPCTMIQLTPHWVLPGDSLWGAHMGYLYSNRFAELLVHQPGESSLHSLLATLFLPLGWGITKFTESYLRWKLPLGKYGMIPDHSFLQDVSSGSIFSLPEDFYDKVEKGNIILKRSRGFGFAEEGVILEREDRPIRTDLAILATSYKADRKLINIFESPILQKYIAHSPTSVIPLFRQTIHPRIPCLAVIGHAESMSSLPLFEIRCQWLAQFLDGKFELPSIKEMEKDVNAWEGHMKQYPGRKFWMSRGGEITTEQNRTPNTEIFSCPICYKPLTRKGLPGLNLRAIYWSAFECQICNKTYSSKDNYLDLTIVAGLKKYSEIKPPWTELFRFPLVSFLYERGWRQNFKRGGFPGPDEEFEMAQRYFRPAEGGLLVDVSCGSGLFSRRFAKSGTYSGVIALDFSENMLRQCYDFIKSDSAAMDANLALVRADVARLPFASGSVDAVHAGAALHCWPSPSNAIAEIARVLRSGGVFVGTTFLRYNIPRILRPLRHVLPTHYVFLTAEEIEDLCASCGLTNYTCEIRQFFIMFSAQKP
ncbi:probable flavin-containing monooxygenase 1 [Punica granatum]|uniref:Flavin-containing monooxygenase n=2 Tax=Punica granatum TaxID=22663 RepID=A0A2I0K839_PUNGR|nr:probable flavin-containing monooxygenase 1 [Punica granatum]XP_031383753.1 probable flavin-containing monooxygenase 1 [Punica granatum]XP_031383755.1 probable flavin-containing monooxygenase 1 [Punica granatum]PKI64715.1 hypothetical protein CRG98_014931 [Punica granatum]